VDRDWEAWYRRGEIPWDKGFAAPPLAELVEETGVGLFAGGPVLVPGCGYGHDVRFLASLGIEALGLDLAESAVAGARGIGDGPGCAFELGDFLSGEWRGGRQWPALWEHTCFCALDPARRDSYAMAAGEAVLPGGVLAGVFYLRPWDSGEEAEGPPFGADIDGIAGHLRPWFDLEKGWVPRIAYPGREGREWIGIFRRRAEPPVAGGGKIG
jgi:SAM-dependent methyltransferase